MKARDAVSNIKNLTLFPPFVVFSLIYLCTLVAYIANNMNPDETAPLGAVWLGLRVIASMLKLAWSVFEYM